MRVSDGVVHLRAGSGDGAAVCRDLEARGIGKGERVMLWGENCAEWVAAFFGCALRGVVVVPMDDGASGDFAARVSGQVEAKLWVCSRRHAEQSGTVPAIALEEVKIPVLSQGTRQGRGTLATDAYLPHAQIGRDGHPADCFYFGDYG